MCSYQDQLSAVKDTNSMIIIKRQLEDVLVQLSLIFSAKKIAFFISRNRQLNKENVVKNAGGWEDWIKMTKNTAEYESEVCPRK